MSQLYNGHSLYIDIAFNSTIQQVRSDDGWIEGNFCWMVVVGVILFVLVDCIVVVGRTLSIAGSIDRSYLFSVVVAFLLSSNVSADKQERWRISRFAEWIILIMGEIRSERANISSSSYSHYSNCRCFCLIIHPLWRKNLCIIPPSKHKQTNKNASFRKIHYTKKSILYSKCACGHKVSSFDGLSEM